MKYQVFAFPLDGHHFESPVFECESDEEARSVARRYAAKRATAVELCRVRVKPRPQVLIVDTIEPPLAKKTKKAAAMKSEINVQAKIARVKPKIVLSCSLWKSSHQ